MRRIRPAQSIGTEEAKDSFQNPFISFLILWAPMSDNVRLQAWQLQNLLRAFVQNATAHPVAHVDRPVQKSGFCAMI